MLPFQPDGFFRFDTLDLMRGDMVSLADFGMKTHAFGGMNANEFRSDYLGKPPFEGGDTHYFMVNTAPVGTEPVTIDKPKAEDVQDPGEPQTGGRSLSELVTGFPDRKNGKVDQPAGSVK